MFIFRYNTSINAFSYVRVHQQANQPWLFPGVFSKVRSGLLTRIGQKSSEMLYHISPFVIGNCVLLNVFSK